MATATKKKARKPATKVTGGSDEVHATPEQAAQWLNVSVWTIYRKMKSAELESVSVFGQKRIPWAVLRAMSPHA